MEEFKIDFLKQEVLGRKVNFSNTDSVIQGCITKADRDMLSGGRFAVKKFKTKTQKARVDWLQKELKRREYKFSRNLIKCTCEELFWSEKKKVLVSINGHKRQYCAFGLAQKLINMTFKYLYMFSDDIKDSSICFYDCDCPIDSIILSKLNSDLKWTCMGEDDYSEMQKEIEGIINNDNEKYPLGNIGRLEYDINWLQKN